VITDAKREKKKMLKDFTFLYLISNHGTKTNKPIFPKSIIFQKMYIKFRIILSKESVLINI
jgi:hypothetical protein